MGECNFVYQVSGLDGARRANRSQAQIFRWEEVTLIQCAAEASATFQKFVPQ